MKNFSFAGCLVVLGLILSNAIYAQQPPSAEGEKGIKFEHTTWVQILEKARNEGKPVFLDAYASWCGPCKWMAKNIFTNDTAAQFYNSNFINAKIDMEKGEGLEIKKKYGVRAYPTLLYIDPSGEMIHRTCGSAPVKDFIQNGKNALNPEIRLSGRMKAFGAGNKDAASTLVYLASLEDACMDYQNELEKYFNLHQTEDLTSRANWQIFSRFTKDMNGSAFKYFMKNREKFESLYTKDSVNMVIVPVYQPALMKFAREKDAKGFGTLKKKIVSDAGSSAPWIILGGEMELYKATKDWKKYASAAEKLINKQENKNVQLMNQAAWTLYENSNDKKLLKMAEKWSKNMIALNDNYALNDTYAAVLFKLGKNDEAKKYAEKAIELGKKENADTKETELLLEKITSKK